MTTRESAERYETRGVLAGAYVKLENMLTHTVSVSDEMPLCSRVDPDHIGDSYASDPNEKPTCKTCLRRDPRWK